MLYLVTKRSWVLLVAILLGIAVGLPLVLLGSVLASSKARDAVPPAPAPASVPVPTVTP
jgi:hypothetical protein